MGYSKKWPLPIRVRGFDRPVKSTPDFLFGGESDSKLSTLKGLSFWKPEALPFGHTPELWVASVGKSLSLTLSFCPVFLWLG